MSTDPPRSHPEPPTPGQAEPPAPAPEPPKPVNPEPVGTPPKDPEKHHRPEPDDGHSEHPKQ